MGDDEKICLEDIYALIKSYYDAQIAGCVEPDERHVPAARVQLAGLGPAPSPASMRLVTEL